MRFRPNLYLGAAVSAVALSTSAVAHHSSAPFYYSDRMGEVEGEIVNARWVNPHVVVELMALDDDGNEQLWKLEGAAVNTLERQGVPFELVNPGDRVRAVGYPSRRGRPEQFTGILYYADGREVILSDGIALNLGLLDQELSTGPRITDLDRAPSSVDSARSVFRVWSRRGEGYPRPVSELQFTAAALAAQQVWDPLAEDTGLQCIPQGMPGIMLNPYPIELIDRGDEILLKVEEWETERIIHMTDGPTDDVPVTPLGYSVGRWEGDALIVDTTRISWEFFDDIGTPQSAQMAIEERFTLSNDGTRLDYRQTATDPETLIEPAVLTGYFWLEEDDEIKPFECADE